uniref:FHA domain-containing protein n=1 Tax=Setaria digitata TaxID=48799 RepID=A0A915Q403_9BILA
MDSEKPLESQNEFPLTQKSSQFSQSLQDWLAGSDERQIYAILHPMAHGLHRIELSADSFEFGRFPTLKESYNFYGLDNDDLKYSISGKHCRIERNNTGGVTYLIDTSRFGTFVNEKLIGKGNSHQLLNGDLISLCDAKFHVFLYVETVTANDVFPVELTAEYLVSNLIIGKGVPRKATL